MVKETQFSLQLVAHLRCSGCLAQQPVPYGTGKGCAGPSALESHECLTNQANPQAQSARKIIGAAYLCGMT